MPDETIQQEIEGELVTLRRERDEVMGLIQELSDDYQNLLEDIKTRVDEVQALTLPFLYTNLERALFHLRRHAADNALDLGAGLFAGGVEDDMDEDDLMLIED